jgi:transposase
VQAVLNGYKHPVSASKWEVANRKIGMFKRQTCGYRDEEYLKLRSLPLHHATYAFTG